VTNISGQPDPRDFRYDAEYYDSGIGGFHKASFADITRAFDGLAVEWPVERILDFGCGNGFYGRFLASHSRHVDAVDGSPVLATHSNRNSYDTFLQRDLGVPWVSDRSYDLLFSIEVIEHVRDYQTFLANAHRALKPGGRLFLTTTTYFWTIFVLLVMYRRDISINALSEFGRGLMGDESARSKFVMRFWEFFTGHYHGFVWAQLRKAFEEAGFKVELQRYLHVQPVFPVHYLDTPYAGSYPLLVRGAAVPMLRAIGTAINTTCRSLDLYAPNILLVGRKPS